MPNNSISSTSFWSVELKQTGKEREFHAVFRHLFSIFLIILKILKKKKEEQIGFKHRDSLDPPLKKSEEMKRAVLKVNDNSKRSYSSH